ncbi:MAG: hypothetical protein LBM61_01970 [Prevotellaceae bacterium]|jgi:hypothetical protein|nr:hypothetical protein [Prevotellaceae bacterium]
MKNSFLIIAKSKDVGIYLIVCVMACMILFSSCATIFTKSRYSVIVNTKPAGATLVITDSKGREVFSGQTPAIVRLKSSDGFFSGADYTLRFSYSGYSNKIVSISSKIEGWYFGNILLGGLIGMLIVDPATGAMWKLDTEYIDETLIPLDSASAGLHIIDKNQIPQAWESHLVAL